MLKNRILSALGEEKLYVDDVFVPWVRTGTGADATITTGIDMTKGYMLWSKGRSGATDHAIYHSARGVTLDLVSNSTAAQTTQATGLKSVSANGHTVGALAKMNTSSATYVDWTFRNADKFYNHAVVTKSSGSNATVSFANLGTLGMVRVKRTDSTGSWYIWHRSLSAGQLLIGETTAAAATMGHVTVSGTTVTLVNGVIADGTYLVEAFAHDTSADGIIQCGSFTQSSAADVAVNIGCEPQFVLIKRLDATGDWRIFDDMRGFLAGSPNTQSQVLVANTAATESNIFYRKTSTGFVHPSNYYASGTQAYIYLTIRRPNKPPTTGTQVYNAIARTGTGAAATVTGVGFAVDLHIAGRRIVGAFPGFADRLRGQTWLNSSSNSGESAAYTDGIGFTAMDGFTVGADTGQAYVNANTVSYVNWCFRRAPGVFSTLCYTGTGSNKTEVHDLTKAPSLMLVKSRSSANDWNVWCDGLLGTEKLVLNSTAAKVTDATAWNSTVPTSSVISLGTAAGTNANAATYVAYLFSNLAGIQSIGTYVGDGTSGRLINCGFTTGSRYVCIKAISTTGNWLVADSTRGITSGNDPYLFLNSTAAEVTTEDWLDPHMSGFLVNQTPASNANVNGVTYMYWAIS